MPILNFISVFQRHCGDFSDCWWTRILLLNLPDFNNVEIAFDGRLTDLPVSFMCLLLYRNEALSIILY